MKRSVRVVIVMLVIAVAMAIVFLGRSGDSPEEPVAEAIQAALPRLVDLGSNQCIPCKRMAPILAELAVEYADHFEVEVIDVREQPEAGSEYGIRLIPTQIFYDAEGNELDRHEGFIDKAAILARWEELGIAFAATDVEG